LRKFLYILFGVSSLLALSAAVLFWLLLPPKIKVPDQQDRIISNVTIWNPGGAPVENQSIVISDGLISDIRATKADEFKSLICLVRIHIRTEVKLSYTVTSI